MNRRHIFHTLLVVLPIPLLAQGNSKGKGKGKGKGHSPAADPGPAANSQYFRQQDQIVLQRYYSGPRDLPPGLRKKYIRTGQLPPGWESKIRPFPPELVRELPPPPPNCDRGFIDGVAVVYDRRTRIILDAIDIVAALTGH